MGIIDAAIPFAAGVILITSPRLFIKSQGEKFEKTKLRLRKMGVVLLAVSAVFLFMALFNV